MYHGTHGVQRTTGKNQFFSFHHLGPQYGIWIIRLGGTIFYQLSHPMGLEAHFK